MQRRDGDSPSYGKAGARLGTAPIVERLELKILALQVSGSPVGRDVSSRRVGVTSASDLSQLEQHQLRTRIQLDAEPVPALLIGLQLVREPLVVHPGRSRDTR